MILREHVGQNVDDLIAWNRIWILGRHGIANALRQIGKRVPVPIRQEYRGIERWAFVTTFEIRCVALAALRFVQRVAAYRLRIGVDAVPHGARLGTHSRFADESRRTTKRDPDADYGGEKSNPPHVSGYSKILVRRFPPNPEPRAASDPLQRVGHW